MLITCDLHLEESVHRRTNGVKKKEELAGSDFLADAERRAMMTSNGKG